MLKAGIMELPLADRLPRSGHPSIDPPVIPIRPSIT